MKISSKLVAQLRSFKIMQDADHFFERFHTQAEAFECADARPALGMRVFAADKDGSGAKQYVVATYRSFWRHYRHWEPSERHFAEVIREGTACRLYFDVEFPIGEHDDANASLALGNARVDDLLSRLDAALRARYGDRYRGPAEVLELDSCTAAKFSRHLIVPNVVFRDTRHAGCFVRAIARELPPDAARCVDLGVYTKNRCFRMLLSSKFGKPRVLTVSARPHPLRWEPPPGAEGGHRLAIFLHSLVCYTSHQIPVLDDADAAAAPAGRPHAPAASCSSARAGQSGTYQRSPFPELDAFVCAVARPGASVLQWTFFAGSGRCGPGRSLPRRFPAARLPAAACHIR